MDSDASLVICNIFEQNQKPFLIFQVVDLEQGVLMNQDGKVLQDSQGKPKRVVLGEDGRTIFGKIFHCVYIHVTYKNILKPFFILKILLISKLHEYSSRCKKSNTAVKNEIDDY